MIPWCDVIVRGEDASLNGRVLDFEGLNVRPFVERPAVNLAHVYRLGERLTRIPRDGSGQPALVVGWCSPHLARGGDCTLRCEEYAARYPWPVPVLSRAFTRRRLTARIYFDPESGDSMSAFRAVRDGKLTGVSVEFEYSPTDAITTPRGRVIRRSSMVGLALVRVPADFDARVVAVSEF